MCPIACFAVSLFNDWEIMTEVVKKYGFGVYMKKKWHLMKFIYAQRFKRKEQIPIERLLIGQQAGYPLETWVSISGEQERISVPLGMSPYVQFLQAVKENPDRLHDDAFLMGTSYFRMALKCIEYGGHFMGAVSQEHVLDWMRSFYARYEGADEASGRVAFEHKGRSAAQSPVVVTRIRHSDCFEIIDGHHRAAISHVRGEKFIPAVVSGKKLSVLQRLLLEVNQINDIELYQPVDRLEVSGWPAVRKCSDRYQMMQAFLVQLGIQQGSVIDLACSYGWFLKQFKQHGFEVTGVDRDPEALGVARLIHGLNPDETHCQRVEDFLPKANRQWDVVLFLSILHHYALGLEPGKTAEMLGKLDNITAKVLFLDTGQNHEKWFRKKLASWDDQYIIDLIKQHTTFKQVIALGKDTDNEGKYKDNYRRTLFACVR